MKTSSPKPDREIALGHSPLVDSVTDTPQYPLDDDDEGFNPDWYGNAKPESPDEQALRLRTVALRLHFIGDKQPYFTGETIPEVTDEEVSAWYANLPEQDQLRIQAEREYFLSERERAESATRKILENIQVSAPGLLEGTLPDELSQLLMDSEYALGVRQVGEVTVQGAQVDVLKMGGVNSGEQGLAQSFNVISSEDTFYATSVVVNGNYGPGRGGKYVIALPVDKGEGSIRGRAMMKYMALEGIVHDHGGTWSVLPMYCAGFIDNDGVFFPNKSFMRADADNIDFGVESGVSDDQLEEDWI